MRKKIPKSSADQGTKGIECREIKGSFSGGAYLGCIENSMNGMSLCNIGIKHITAVVDLTYNMFRKVQLVG